MQGATATIEGHAIPLARHYSDLPTAKRIELGVRPEYVHLAPKGLGLPVQVKRIDDIGRQRLARVELGGRPLVATVAEGQSLDGTEAALTLDPRQIHIYADGALVPGEAA